jgi:hypothetical protein
MQRRYLDASPPREGENQSLASRLRLLLTSSLEPVASLDALPRVERTQGETLDCTNNASERAIGWWIKERYRTRRGDIRAGECGGGQSSAGLLWQLSQY